MSKTVITKNVIVLTDDEVMSLKEVYKIFPSNKARVKVYLRMGRVEALKWMVDKYGIELSHSIINSLWDEWNLEAIFYGEE